MIVDSSMSEPRFYHPICVFQQLLRIVGANTIALRQSGAEALLLFGEAGGGGPGLEMFLDCCRSIHKCSVMQLIFRSAFCSLMVQGASIARRGLQTEDILTLSRHERCGLVEEVILIISNSKIVQ